MKTAGLIFNHDSEDRFNQNGDYIRWIEQDLEMMVTLIDPFDQKVKPVDLLVMPGGSDINPLKYMSYWPQVCGLPNRALEFFDDVVLPSYINAGIPIYATCRGFQALNVFFGGTLKPHVNEPTSYQNHDTPHYVQYGGSFYPCGSWHHQAIDVVGKDLDILMMGYDKKTEWKDGKTKTSPNIDAPLNVEGIKHKSLPILGLQTHVERQFCAGSAKHVNNIAKKLIFSILK